jgi:formamidopyrimidine-DNA glycosylase
MPELPEVETVRAGFSRIWKDSRITRLQAEPP